MGDDLLSSILSSMDAEAKAAAPSAVEAARKRQEAAIVNEYRAVRASVKRKLERFAADASATQLEFPPMEKLKRNIMCAQPPRTLSPSPFRVGASSCTKGGATHTATSWLKTRGW